MAKRRVGAYQDKRYFRNFMAFSIDVLAYLSLIISAVFIVLGLNEAGWSIFSSASFWTVINSFWLFSILMFHFAHRLSGN